MKIAVDAMGGDFGASPLVEGALWALKERDFSLVLIGDKTILEPLIPANMVNRVQIIHCEDFIAMDDGATAALKRKDSSIYLAMEMLKNKEVDAVVSAGQSGATMSLATLKIGRLKGISRPAICTLMPRTDGNKSLIVDAGANVDCKPENLFEFGVMGHEYAKWILKYPKVRIGLLANGEEECKGNENTKAAMEILRNHPSFIGNIEGNNISTPENLYIIGTVNMDDTTFSFSTKVLDRANTIEFSEVDLETLDFLTGEAETLVVDNSLLKAKFLNIKDAH